MRLPIHHTFGPMVTPEQWRLAFELQFQPQRWREGPELESLRGELVRAHGASAFLFASGREALLAALRSIDLSPGEEVILQGYTCTVIPNAIHAAGGVPVYTDIDPQTLNIDLSKVQSRITHRTRAIICQHTFGIPADIKRLRAICDKRHLAFIEDCAHIIPDASSHIQTSFLSSSREGGIGALGDLLILSFGRDKAISGVAGGAVLSRHTLIAERLSELEEGALNLSLWHILNLFGYPLRYHFAKRVWGRLPQLAKLYLKAIRLVGLLEPVLREEEKRGKMGVLLHRMPNACAALALQQFRDLSKINEHRRKLTELYLRSAREKKWNIPQGLTTAPALQKFPLYVRSADELRAALKRKQIYLDDGWCGAVVNPRDTDQEAAGYEAGKCPKAEEAARHIVNLPTHITMSEEQARELIHVMHGMI